MSTENTYRNWQVRDLGIVMNENYPEKVFSGRFSNFFEAAGTLDPYDDKIWADKSVNRFEQLFGAPEQAQLNDFREYLISAAVYKYGSEEKPLRVLDVGGNLGQVALNIFSMFKTKLVRQWDIVETKSIVDLQDIVKKLDHPIDFYSTDEIKLLGKYDLLHFGSVLQYFENWEKKISDYFEIIEPKIVVFSDAMVGNVSTFVALQEYYGKKMPYRILSQSDFMNFMEKKGYILEVSTNYIHNKTGYFFESLELKPDESFLCSQNYIFTKNQGF